MSQCPPFGADGPAGVGRGEGVAGPAGEVGPDGHGRDGPVLERLDDEAARWAGGGPADPRSELAWAHGE